MRAAEEWCRRHPRVLDASLAAGLFLLLALPAWGGMTSRDAQRGVTEASVSTAMTLVLAVRRVRPTLTFAVVALSCLVQVIAWSDPLPADLAFLVAVYSLAAWSRHRLARILGLVVCVLAGPVAGIRWGGGSVELATIVSSALLSGIAVVVWVIGDLLRNRRVLSARLVEQNRALVRDRQQREELAAQRERSRIARDMHDVVAHGLSVIVVQADGAAFAARQEARRRGDELVESLETIAVTARAALDETRHLVGVLRRDSASSAEDGEDYAPVAGVGDVVGLVDRVRSAGLEVRLVLPDTARDVITTEASVAAYRITQESLTNVLKHAGPGACATVRLARGPGGVELEVTDDGRGAADDTTVDGGSGLVGMRERAEAAGGWVEAGPLPNGGYRVRAYLPEAKEAR